MFEKEIQFITDFNLNRIKTLGKSLNLNELFSTELHPAIIKYISGRIDYMIFEERKLLIENSRFDYSGSKISGYFDLIAEEIKKTKKLSFSEVEDFTKKGVIFNANFCVQPKSTLINLIYKDSGISKSTAEIRIYLNYIYYYDYYRTIINSYISKRKIVNLSQDEFSVLMDKIDNQLMSSKREDIIVDALNSISDFYNDGGISKSSVQPALLEAYLKEKKLDVMIESFQKEINDNRNKININEIKKILFAKLPEKKEEIKIPEVQSEKKNSQEFKTESEKHTDLEFRVIEETENKVSEEKNPEVYFSKENIKKPDETVGVGKLQHEKNEGEHQDGVPEDARRKDYFENKDNIQSQVEKEPEEIIFDEEISEAQGHKDEIDMEELIEEDSSQKKIMKKDKDIFSFLAQKDIEKVVSSIFNDDEDEFANTLEKISESETYEKAAEILQSVFYTYRINPYKREAVVLTNAVSNYFDQR